MTGREAGTDAAPQPKILSAADPVRTLAARGKTVIAWLRIIDDDPRTERVIMSLIIINAVILGLETNKAAMASHGYGPCSR